MPAAWTGSSGHLLQEPWTPPWIRDGLAALISELEAAAPPGLGGTRTTFRQQGQVRLMTGSLDEELGRFSEDLGISRGELLLMTRLALFVEGPHDQIILDEWFGDSLRAAGIRMFPVHGVDHLPALADSEITAALGIRIATLSDDTSPSRASSGSPRTRGEHAVGRLLEEAARAGIQVHPVGLDQPDILYYLDETICRHAAPAFPGWDAAEAERRNARSRMRKKRWVEDQYGLSLTREGVRRLAQMCRQEHKIPAELTRKVYGLTAYATAPKRAS